MTISRLVNKASIGNLGYGYYVKDPNYFTLEHDFFEKKINDVLDQIIIKPKRVVFSSKSLNSILNELISFPTYIVEVEKEYIQTVFELLKTKFSNVILLKPSEIEKENYWKPNAIYVYELFKRSPTIQDGSIKIEKLIFDLLFNDNYSSFYSGQDIELMIDKICSTYVINYKTLFSYASRRNKYSELFSKIQSYIPIELLTILKK